MLKVALVSRWHVHANEYANAVKQYEDAEITAVWDENAERGKKWAEELGCHYYGDYGMLLRKADIDAVTEPVLDAVVFQMTDLLSDGMYAEALLKLQTLLKMQQEPLAILGAVGAHFRKLATARILTDNGRSASHLAKLYGIPDFVAKRIMESARRVKPQFCARAAALILETDYQMKTSFDDTERLLELLILRLAQEAKNG